MVWFVSTEAAYPDIRDRQHIRKLKYISLFPDGFLNMYDIFLGKQVFTTCYFVFPVDRVTICSQAVPVRKLWLLTHCLFSTTLHH